MNKFCGNCVSSTLIRRSVNSGYGSVNFGYENVALVYCEKMRAMAFIMRSDCNKHRFGGKTSCWLRKIASEFLMVADVLDNGELLNQLDIEKKLLQPQNGQAQLGQGGQNEPDIE